MSLQVCVLRPRARSPRNPLTQPQTPNLVGCVIIKRGGHGRLSSTHSVLAAPAGACSIDGAARAGGCLEMRAPGPSLEELWSSYTTSVETKIASEYRLPPVIQQSQQLRNLQQSQHFGKVSSPSAFASASAWSSPSTRGMSILEKFVSAGGTAVTGTATAASPDGDGVAGKTNSNISSPPAAPASATDSALVMSLQAEIGELRARLTHNSSEASQRENALERELETALERAELTISALMEQLVEATARQQPPSLRLRLRLLGLLSWRPRPRHKPPILPWTAKPMT